MHMLYIVEEIIRICMCVYVYVCVNQIKYHES